VLTITIEAESATSTRVRLSGAIDETCDVGAVLSRGNGELILNLRDVARINSFGINVWRPSFMATVKKRRITIDELSVAFVSASNVIWGLIDGATIRSFMAPYYCEPCRRNEDIKFDKDEVPPEGSDAPPRACPVCAQPMIFEEVSQFFDSIRRVVDAAPK
jgi:hypothetical protein